MTTAIIPERLAEITHLDAGSHAPDEGTYCAMELVAYVAGEPHSERPDCACPVIAAYTMRLNDALGEEDRQRLLPFIARIAGSRATPAAKLARCYLAATRAVKVFAPLALEARGLPAAAATLRALPDIVDRDTASRRAAAAAAAYAANAAAAYDAYDAAYAAAAAAAAYAANAAAAAAAPSPAIVDEALRCLSDMLDIGVGEAR
jgi:hypothetical protein